jgi:hypothetical protein
MVDPRSLQSDTWDPWTIDDREAEMNAEMRAETRNQVEKRLASMLRQEINAALRAPDCEDVTVLDVEIVARRLEGVGPEAQFQFTVEPEFTWTWKRR